MAMRCRPWALRLLLPLMMLRLGRSLHVATLRMSSPLAYLMFLPLLYTVQPPLVLAALRSFQWGTSGSSALHPQHLLDAICGSTAPSAAECLNSLTHCINTLLAGTLDARLAPWFCRAPFTAMIKKSGGFRPIAVSETASSCE